MKILLLLKKPEILGVIISFLALLISFKALQDGKTHYMDSNRAKLVFNIVQQDHKLYLFVINLGMVSAFDVAIRFNYDIENPVQNLRVIPPDTTFRYLLLDSTQVSAYPKMQELKIIAEYKDIYCSSSHRYETSSFPVLELLKYTSTWNEKQHCFDINKI